jgi:hypothetical protein
LLITFHAARVSPLRLLMTAWLAGAIANPRTRYLLVDNGHRFGIGWVAALAGAFTADLWCRVHSIVSIFERAFCSRWRSC